MRYDQVYERRAQRAIEQAGTNIRTFLEDLQAAGASLESIERQLLADLENEGPIFGSFLRSLRGAAMSAVSAAERQGAIIGELSDDQALQELLGLADTDFSQIIDDADAELLESIEDQAADVMQMTWVATLERTCDRCLPLHGTSRTYAEWMEIGLLPETIHSGWTSECHCVLVPASMQDRQELVSPLVRERVESPSGLKGSKRTQRMVAQKSLEKARAAVEAARESLEGRRTLRLMGSVNAQGADQ